MWGFRSLSLCPCLVPVGICSTCPGVSWDWGSWTPKLQATLLLQAGGSGSREAGFRIQQHLFPSESLEDASSRFCGVLIGRH